MFFWRSSHNTYLIGRQLIGRSSAAAYTHALTCGARCVEIDAWSSPQGLVVTHGYTLTHSVSLKDVCKAIGDAVTENDWPVMVSLECHVGVPEQPEMIKIMEDAWGEKLLRRQIDGLDVERVTPADLRGKILLMVRCSFRCVSGFR
jgi:phosphatidylinositol phospholipase C delta